MKKTKVVSALTALAMCLGNFMSVTAFAEADKADEQAESIEATAGDIDCDGKITATDATQLLKTYTEMSSGRYELKDGELQVLDVDSSGKIEASDASLLMKYYAGLSGGFNGSLEEYIDCLEKLEEERRKNTTTTTTATTTTTTTTTTKIKTTTTSKTTTTKTTTATTTATTTNGVMLDVMEYCQYPDYPTGCESAALYILLKYYDVDVTMEQIVEALPKGSTPYYYNGVLYGANPETEFVGDPRNDWSYGVFNEPVAKVAEKFRSGVKTKKGASFTELINLLNSGSPVEVWFAGNPEKGITYAESWKDPKTGETVRWPRGEHAIVVCGHDASTVTYRDPITGSSRTVSNSLFINVFNQMGCRILYYEN